MLERKKERERGGVRAWRAPSRVKISPQRVFPSTPLMSRGRALAHEKKPNRGFISFAVPLLPRMVERRGGMEGRVAGRMVEGMLERDITGRRTMEQLFEGEGWTGGKSSGRSFFVLCFVSGCRVHIVRLRGSLDGTIISTILRIDS